MKKWLAGVLFFACVSGVPLLLLALAVFRPNWTVGILVASGVINGILVWIVLVMLIEQKIIPLLKSHKNTKTERRYGL